MAKEKGNVGLIGLGLVGSALAGLLIKDGFHVIGHDILREKREDFRNAGGKPVKNAAEVAQQAGTIILSLMNTEIVKDVIWGTDGILEASHRPALVIDTTTGDPGAASDIHCRLREQESIEYVDATIAGSSTQIASKEGVFLVGASQEGFMACRPILEVIAGKIFHVGGPGAGLKAKLVVNLVLGLNRAVLAEGITFAEAVGFEPRVALDLILSTPASSRIAESKGPRMVSGDFAPEAKLYQHLKDVHLITEMARTHGIEHLPFSEVHLDILQHAVDEGLGDLDNSAIITLLRGMMDRKGL